MPAGTELAGAGERPGGEGEAVNGPLNLLRGLLRHPRRTALPVPAAAVSRRCRAERIEADRLTEALGEAAAYRSSAQYRALLRFVARMRRFSPFNAALPLPDGWRRLRNIDEDFFRWPGDSKPEGYGEVGLETARWRASNRGPITFNDAVELARHWLKDWPGTVNFEDLRDWLVASFLRHERDAQRNIIPADFRVRCNLEGDEQARDV